LGYRPLSALSVGQKCTALLSLVLLESPATLLVDQPEDDLDNQFIFDQIVATLRREKERRQFLIATHNANIPVSGDAELIIVLEADERHGWVGDGNIGSIDTETIKQSVERILEGGENAFRIRKEKYGIR
jgi:ABC-type cobalamin/Fe3+-siderophores transport system ATPase subunit